MKRSASQQKITNHVVKIPRHVLITRLTQRKEEKERDRLEMVQAKMATPLLRALPLVVGSGFLYKWECRAVALASKTCQAVIAEVQHEIPRHCQVEIKCDWILRGRNRRWPMWVRERGLQHVIPAQEFSRAIFQKLCDLKVDAETTERKKEKVRDALPKWGVDFLSIRMLVWDAFHRNNGGIHFSLYKGCSATGGPQNRLRGWTVRMDDDLWLWTWDAFHKWKKIYNHKPLWAWNWDREFIRSVEAGQEEAAAAAATAAEEAAGVAAEAAAAAAPEREQEGLGPGRIDYYFQPLR